MVNHLGDSKAGFRITNCLDVTPFSRETKWCTSALGAGKGKPRYKGSGLGSRLQNYCSRDFTVKAREIAERRYNPTAQARGITSLVTIGFAARYWYMASALEAFLIESLQPERNAVGKR